MQQKTAIALGFIRPFRVLLLDEPFVGLDQPSRTALVELATRARSDGAAVVVATHQLDFSTQTDRVIALRDGQLIYDGHPDHADTTELIQG